jgi:Spy/CpxP family protein refolding chaperone
MWRSASSVSNDSRSVCGVAMWLRAVALAVCATAAVAAAADVESARPAAEVAPTPRLAARDRVAATIDDRVRLLSKELELDTRQQRELRAILERQREAVKRVWGNADLLPTERGAAVRAITDRTADQTRALLTEAQRKKYNPPKPAGGSSPASAAPDVAVWMEAMHSR